MNKPLTVILLLIAMAMPVKAQFTPLPDDYDTDEQVEADGDEAIRENPTMEWGEDLLSDFDYSRYPFLRHHANNIELNGADWSQLIQRFADIDDEVLSIVHIGDSHIQGEGSTSRTRNLLQRRYGSAGRGLVIPFRLAGTNQPNDYSITSSSTFTTAKLVSREHAIPVGFTGIALRPSSSTFDFTITVKPATGVPRDFDYIKMYTHGSVPRLVAASSTEYPTVRFETEEFGDTLAIWLVEPVNDITLTFERQGTCDIYGFLLENSMTGVEYSAIGNNGAAYTSYNGIGTTGRDISSLSPNLVIISMGTNEAFGKITDSEFYQSVDRLVGDIRRHNPQAAILIETPAECQRSVTVKTPVKKRNRKGRLRTTYKTSHRREVNHNIKRLRDVLLKYGRDNGIATYDWYEAAGGDGSSEHWVSHQLLSSDRIHDTWNGYTLHGSMLYDALVKIIEQ